MEKIKKLFGNFEMTWKRLIIFSVICGIYTAAVLLMPALKDNALREIGVGYECWFLLAIFVVSNCRDYKDAAIKCFVFFLISQPLVYILESIILKDNLLKQYYLPWFIKTLLTLPGGAVAYQIKRKDLLGSVILAVAGSCVSAIGIFYFIYSIRNHNISYTIYGIVLIICVIILGLIFCDIKKNRIVYYAIVAAVTVIFSIYLIFIKGFGGKYEYKLSDENWKIDSAFFTNGTAHIENNVLVVEYQSNEASCEIELINSRNEKIYISITVKNGEITIEETK